MDGVFAVAKPLDWTSFDVVAVVRRAAGVRRVGHGGTLDPKATGVLPVLVGSATKFTERLHTAPKVYGALIRFGRETATDDREGATTREAPVPDLEVAAVDRILEPFRGAIQQVPPAYAAVKVGGRTAYAIARGGGTVELAARSVQVDRLAIASWIPPDLRLLVVCSSGTYVRSLARDIGRAAGSAAHLGALVRLAVGALELGSAVDIERIRGASASTVAASLRPADDSLLALDQRFRDGDAAAILDGWEGD